MLVGKQGDNLWCSHLIQTMWVLGKHEADLSGETWNMSKWKERSVPQQCE